VHKRLSLNESQLNGLNFPVSFIGTYDYSRDPFLEAVGWDRLYTWGNGWNRYKYYAHHLDRISNQAVYHWEYSDILNHSQIALGLLREEAQDLHTQRTFEIPACGAFQLAPRNDELLQFFTEDREIVCFSTLDELKDKVSYYLKNPDERNRIAKAGWEKCLSGKHSYQDRVQSFLECISGSTLAVDTRIREESFEAATAR
jgi:spore maturation protein CgeB